MLVLAKVWLCMDVMGSYWATKPCAYSTRHTLYILYTYSIHTLYTLYTYSIHTLYTLYTYSIHTLYILYTHSIHTLYILYTLYTHSIHTLYILYTLYTYSIHTGCVWDSSMVRSICSRSSDPPRSRKILRDHTRSCEMLSPTLLPGGHVQNDLTPTISTSLQAEEVP